jgi:hypothetical protein
MVGVHHRVRKNFVFNIDSDVTQLIKLKSR